MRLRSHTHRLKNQIVLAYHTFTERKAHLRAAHLTMASLLAAVPIITIIFGILGFTPALQGMQAHLLSLLETHLAPGSSETILPYLVTFSEQAKSLPLAGLVMLIITALLLLNSFEISVQDIWQINSLRNLRDRLLTYWAMLTLGPIVLATSLSLYGTMLTFRWQGIEIGSLMGNLIQLSSLTLYFIMLFALNYLTPNALVKPKFAAISALVGTLSLLMINWLFRSFAQLFANYQVVYGAFAAIPTLILWLQFSWFAILFSVCLCASLHKQDLANPER